MCAPLHVYKVYMYYCTTILHNVGRGGRERGIKEEEKKQGICITLHHTHTPKKLIVSKCKLRNEWPQKPSNMPNMSYDPIMQCLLHHSKASTRMCVFSAETRNDVS